MPIESSMVSSWSMLEAAAFIPQLPLQEAWGEVSPPVGHRPHSNS